MLATSLIWHKLMGTDRKARRLKTKVTLHENQLQDSPGLGLLGLLAASLALPSIAGQRSIAVSWTSWFVRILE